MNIAEKIQNFYNVAIKCYGKEIALPSNQYFSMDQIVDEGKEELGKHKFQIQYGFPQSGAIILKFIYNENENSILIDGLTVYAPPEEKELIIANFTPQTQVGEVGIRINTGIDNGTQKYTNSSEMELNPNVFKLFDMAILDMQNVKIMGECREAVAADSPTIPCCNTVSYPVTSKKI